MLPAGQQADMLNSPRPPAWVRQLPTVAWALPISLNNQDSRSSPDMPRNNLIWMVFKLRFSPQTFPARVTLTKLIKMLTYPDTRVPPLLWYLRPSSREPLSPIQISSRKPSEISHSNSLLAHRAVDGICPPSSPHVLQPPTQNFKVWERSTFLLFPWCVAVGLWAQAAGHSPVHLEVGLRRNQVCQAALPAYIQLHLLFTREAPKSRKPPVPSMQPPIVSWSLL